MANRRADELYGLPLEEFTSARNELARELRKAGRREAAAEVAALRKPTLASWIANQLARRRPEEIRELLRIGKELRRAQREALSGRGGERLQAASARQRDVIHDLLDVAREILEESGRSARGSELMRVGNTLRAAAGSEDAGKALTRGRLTEDLEQSGFGPLLQGAPAKQTDTPAKPARRPSGIASDASARRAASRRRSRAAEDRKRELAALRERLAEAKALARERRKDTVAAERAAERARAEAEDARAAADRAAALAGEAEAAVEELDRQVQQGKSSRV